MAEFRNNELRQSDLRGGETRTSELRAVERRLDQPRDPRLRLRLPRLDPEAFGRWAEAIARFMGTARFLFYMTVFIVLWFGWNTLAPGGWRFDPYTFTFLTLMLSLQASYAAPLILLAQNRQADRDRLSLEQDRQRAAMQKADTEYLAREIASLRIAVGEVATRDFLRSELNRLTEELDETAERRLREERKQLRRLARRTADVGPADEPGDAESDERPFEPSGKRTEHNENHKKGRRTPQGARRAPPSG